MEMLEGKNEGKEPLPPIKPLDKIIVAFAGPLFSLGLAFFFALLVWGFGKPVREQLQSTVVGSVVPGMPAEKAGVLPGDEILEIDGVKVQSFGGMVDSIMEGSIYLENVTSTELESHFDKYEDQYDPSPEEIATAKKSIVDTNIPLHLSLFHTMFNLCNIALLIGFSPRIAKLVERLVKDTGKSESI